MTVFETDPDNDSWVQYWNAPGEGAFMTVRGEAQAKVLNAWWLQKLEVALMGKSEAQMLELACGDAAVTKLALSVVSSGGAVRMTCSDIAISALRVGRNSVAFADVDFCVADTRRTPFQDKSFDLVVSQYGIEYGGMSAFQETARLISPEGAFLALVHKQGGGVERECSQNLVLLNLLVELNLIGLASDLVMVSSDGKDNRVTYLMSEFELATRKMEETLVGQRLGSAKEYVIRLVKDLFQVINRRHAYAPGDLTPWFGAKTEEINSYIVRMRTMTEAAMNEQDVSDMGQSFQSAGLNQFKTEIVEFNKGDDAGWGIQAGRHLGS